MTFMKPNGEGVPMGWIGNGLFAIILREGENALKIPRQLSTRWMTDDNQRDEEEYINEGNRDALKREAEAYRRLGNHESIAQCLRISEEGILLKYYPRGDLKHYMKDHPDISRADKACWILSLVEGYAHLHRSNVLMYDAAPRNLLISDDFTLKMIDFGQCSCLDMDIDINTTADDDGMTARCNIFDLGSLIYSIAVWEEFDCDLMTKKWVLPSLSDLPTTEGLFCGNLIRKCWSGQFDSMEEVLREAQPLREDMLQSDGKAKAPATITDSLWSGIWHLLSYLNSAVRYKL
ncbi:MAG: hypothetical protein Q9163_005616 [Psora crenata]